MGKEMIRFRPIKPLQSTTETWLRACLLKCRSTLDQKQKGRHMIQRLKFAFLVIAASATIWLAPSVKADEWNKRTVFTFNEPVEIPGQVLPAGTYVFKLLDDSSDRAVVQIFNEDETHLITTVMAIPDYRVKPSGDTVIRLAERPAGSPQAVETWFYPGDNSGREFVYAKTRVQLAKAEPTPPPALVPVGPETQETSVEEPKEEPPAPAIVQEQEVIIAQAMPTDYGLSSTDIAPPATLPKTAGNFALIPLLGLGLLSAGFATFRFATKQT